MFNSPELRPARVSILDRGRFQLLGLGAPVWAVLPPGRRDLPRDPLESPAVGDWVAVRVDGQAPVIEAILPRRSCFTRRDGHTSRPQVVATNIDRVLIVTAVGKDLNPRRLERYLATVLDGGAEPVIVVNKTDLALDWAEITRTLRVAAPGVPTAFVSALAQDGIRELAPFITPGKTLALVGSSGVGKSSLTNRLLGAQVQDTGGIREHDERGKHTTTRRELFLTPEGSILIDTPGLRTVLLWQAEEGLAQAFADVEALAERCRFRDCTHEAEPGCAVMEAVEDGELDPSRVGGYRKLKRELEWGDKRTDPRAMKEVRQRWKVITKEMRRRNRHPE